MTDRESNVEIEDVVSSIRRLVSDGPKPDRGLEADRPEAPLILGAVDDRLVLSSSDRVGETIPTEAGFRDKADVAPDPLADDGHQEPQAEREKASALVLLPTPLTVEPSTNADLKAWDQDAQKDQTPEQPSSDADREALIERFAAVESGLQRIDDEWEPEEAGTDDYAGRPVRPLKWDPAPFEDTGPSDTAEAPSSPSDVVTPIHSFDAADKSRASGFAEAPMAPLRPAIERLGEAANSTHRKGEPAGPFKLTQKVRIEHRGFMPDQPASEPAGATETAAVPEKPSPEDLLNLIDEDTLRALVADIVRQELKGGLGERITRNVRKLVRREINRALAAQQFD